MHQFSRFCTVASISGHFLRRVIEQIVHPLPYQLRKKRTVSMSGFEFWEWPKNRGIWLDSFLLVTSVTTPHLSHNITTTAELVLDSSFLYLPLVLSKSNDDVLNASFTKFKFYVIFLFWNAVKWHYSYYSINCKFHHVSCYYALTIFIAQK